MGGGTPVAALAPMLGGAFGSPDAAFGVLHDLLGALHQRLEAMRTGVERREALANATPSIWPVAGWLSSAYGNRRDPFTGGADFHPGLDISADHGTPVHATADGTVQTAGWNGNYGNLLVVDHGFAIQTRYGHLSKFTAREGERVRRGQIIGHVGSTGRSTSPHLHYEILTNGALTNPLRILAR
jgi:murein DD-endopeptidase MepM/ murein hydrolase activator NlpD